MRADESGAPLTIGIDGNAEASRVVLMEEDGTLAGSALLR